MGTIAGNMYEIDYFVVQPATTVTDPPTSVTGPTKNWVNAASQGAAVTALAADVTTGTQTLKVIDIKQVGVGMTMYN